MITGSSENVETSMQLTPAILVTAPGGTRAGQGLIKIAEYASRARKTVRVLELDNTLPKAYLRLFPHDTEYARLVSEVTIADGQALSALLRKPRAVLATIWIEAIQTELERLAKTNESTTSADIDVLLIAFHAAFYSTQSREFFSPVSVGVLRDALKTHGFVLQGPVVTLIDDVYDCYRQLARPGHAFAPRSQPNSYQKNIDALVQLHEALQWRAMELLKARDISQDLSMSNLLLSTRHSLDTAYSLIVAQTDNLYVSHPIFDVRADSQFKSEIRDLEMSLRHSRSLPRPVVPTAIDELRIVSDNGNLVPKLGSRWDAPAVRDAVFVEPHNSELNPLDRFEGGWTDASPEFVSGLMQALFDALKAQISARDKALVEQASALVVWRPLYNGGVANGVVAEVKYRNELRFHQLGPIRPCYVYYPRIDLAHWRISQIVGLLKKFDEPSGARALDSNESQSIRRALFANGVLVDAIARGDATGEQFMTAVQELSYQAQIPIGGISAVAGEPEFAESSEIRHEWNVQVTLIQGRDPFKSHWAEQDRIVEGEVTAGEFVTEVSQWHADFVAST